MPCQNHPWIDLGLVRCARCAAELCPDCVVGLFGVPLCGPCKTEWVLDRLSGLPANALDLAHQVAAQHPGGIRVLKQMFRELDGTAARVAYENEQLMRFQEHGAGIPRTR